MPQGSILGPLLFNDIFYFVDSDITNYADDTTPYSVEGTWITCLDLWKQISVRNKWFADNFLRLNADKCHLLVSKHDKDVFINVGNEVIECESTFRDTIDNKLKFDMHLTKLCKKAPESSEVSH